MRQNVLTRARGRARHFGYSLFEISIALGVTALTLATMLTTANDAQHQVKDAATADRLKQIYIAASQFTQGTAQTLASSITVGSTPVAYVVGRTTTSGSVPSGSLQALGYLPTTFVDVNPYGQHHVVLIRQPTAGNFDVLVETYGGQTISDLDLGRIALKIGAPGGMILNTPPSSVAANTIQGIGGGWAELGANWATGSYTSTIGHVMAISYASQTTMLADFLYRNKITGVPEANRMHTSIDVNSNQLNNAQQIDNGTASSTNSDATHDITVGSPLVGSGTVPSTGTAGQVNFDSGLFACRANATGCEIQLSDDGGIKDNNDGYGTWTSTAGSGGFKIAKLGSYDGNLIVGGITKHYGDVNMKASTLISWPDVTTLTLGAAATNILHVYGGSLTVDNNLVVGGTGSFTGNVYAPIYYDSNNNAYYLEPSTTSNLNIVQAYQVGAYGYSPSSGFVKNPKTGGTIYGGIHTQDVQAEGGLYVGGTGSPGGASGSLYPTAWMLKDGSGGLTGAFTLGSVGVDGSACSPNGSVAASSDGTGMLEVCFNAIWTPSGATAKTSFYALPTSTAANTAYSLGTHFYCALADTFESATTTTATPNESRVLPASYDSNNRIVWSISRGTHATSGPYASCIDY